MDTKTVNTVSLLATLIAIFIVEVGASVLPLSPLVATAAARCMEMSLILMVLHLFNSGVSVIGLSRDRLASGAIRGLYWSAGFGLMAAVAGGMLYVSEIDPLRLVHVNLPEGIWDKVLFFSVGGILAPVAEEIFFRGILYGYAKGALERILPEKLRIGAVLGGILVSTYFFVAAHAGTSGIPLPQLVGGIVFCIAYEVEKSLMAPIIIHSIGNLALFSLSLWG